MRKLVQYDTDLDRWRREQGLSMTELALRVDCSPQHIGQICAGRSLPSVDLAYRIQRATSHAIRVGDWRSEWRGIVFGTGGREDMEPQALPHRLRQLAGDLVAAAGRAEAGMDVAEDLRRYHGALWRLVQSAERRAGGEM